MKTVLALVAACTLLCACSTYEPAYDKLHEDVFGCPPVHKQDADKEYDKNPDIEKILGIELPRCDDGKPVYEGPVGE